MSSYLSPNVEKRRSKTAFGLFAKGNIKAGEVIVDFKNGLGKFVNEEESDRLFEDGMDYMIQVDDDLFWAATEEDEIEDADFINHSCEPNCGIRDSMTIVSVRPIKKGEEITFDYATSESSDYEFKCNCGSKNCRRVITGDDWKNPILQKKYKKYFSDYLKKKIKAN